MFCFFFEGRRVFCGRVFYFALGVYFLSFTTVIHLEYSHILKHRIYQSRHLRKQLQSRDFKFAET